MSEDDDVPYHKAKALVIDGNTSITGRLRISPDHNDEFALEIGWMRIDDLISMLSRLKTGGIDS